VTERAGGRRPRLGRLLAVVALVAIALTGCAGAQPHGEELYATARQANLLFKETVAAVLIHISDGTWQIQDYGDLPLDCHPGYAFSLHRTTFEGWTLDRDAATTAEGLAAWLGDRGWTAQIRSGGDGQPAVEASAPALQIASLVIEIRDGDGTADAIGVGATSDCVDGDAEELKALLYPGYPDRPVAHEPLPAGEPAGATPIFGFTEDGSPR